MNDLILVEDGNTAFYAPASQAERWTEVGCAVYELALRPANAAARAASAPEPAKATADGSQWEPAEKEEIG